MRQKLRVTHQTAWPNITRPFGIQPAELTQPQIMHTDYTDYLLGGSLVIKNGKVDKLLFDGGYAQASGTAYTASSFTFKYYNQDHLGNNREVESMRGGAHQVTNYYPFGAPFVESSDTSSPDYQPYKYNGKELDRMHGLDTYDYGARQYNPIVGRWDRMDPLCEKYYNISPYAYCGNNPVNAIDPNGELVVYAEGVSDTFKNSFAQAVQYLNSHGCGRMLKELNDSKKTYYISESTDQKNKFDYKTRTISWSPKIGLKTNEYQYLSPATILNHEIDHALEYDKNPNTFKNNIIKYEDNNPDSFYYSPEEKRVITGSEQKTAKALGEIKDDEVTRTDHFGQRVLMKSTISNAPLIEEKEIIVYPQNKNME